MTAVQKHVAVLEAAGLVTKERRGREQLVRSNLDTLRRAQELLGRLEAIWRTRIDQIDEILADDPNPEDTNSEDTNSDDTNQEGRP